MLVNYKDGSMYVNGELRQTVHNNDAMEREKNRRVYLELRGILPRGGVCADLPYYLYGEPRVTDFMPSDDFYSIP